MVCSNNNRADIIYNAEGKQFKLRGEPTEAALKVLAEKLGRYDSQGPMQMTNHKEKPTGYGAYLMEGVSTVATLDFSSERKAMSTVVSGYNGRAGNQVLLKGAPERVIEKCSKVLTSNGQETALNADAKQRLNKKIKTVAEQGFRVLGIAIGLDGGNMKDITRDNASAQLSDTDKYQHFESGLAFLGYVCIKDPVRAEVK